MHVHLCLHLWVHAGGTQNDIHWCDALRTVSLSFSFRDWITFLSLKHHTICFPPSGVAAFSIRDTTHVWGTHGPHTVHKPPTLISCCCSEPITHAGDHTLPLFCRWNKVVLIRPRRSALQDRATEKKPVRVQQDRKNSRWEEPRSLLLHYVLMSRQIM